MHNVYILTSLKDNSKYYIGITENITKRLKEHNAGKSTTYSKAFLPWKIETYTAFSNRLLALKFEKYLKHGSGHAFLKKRFLP